MVLAAIEDGRRFDGVAVGKQHPRRGSEKWPRSVPPSPERYRLRHPAPILSRGWRFSSSGTTRSTPQRMGSVLTEKWACDEAGRPYHPDTLSKRWSKLIRDAGSAAHQPALGAAHVRHDIAPPRRAVVRRRGVARTRRCKRYSPDLCPLPTRCAEGRFGDIGRSCDKHRDNRSAGDEYKIGADRSSAWSEPISISAPEGIRTPNLLIRSQMLYPLSYGRRSSVVWPTSQPRRRREDLNLRSPLRATTH